MMFSENDRHCIECLCSSCARRATDDCLDGPDVCDKCENDCHVGQCWYHESELSSGEEVEFDDDT